MLYMIHTVCPVSSDPFYLASLLYKMGHYFLDILYVECYSLGFLYSYALNQQQQQKTWLNPPPTPNTTKIYFTQI